MGGIGGRDGPRIGMESFGRGGIGSDGIEGNGSMSCMSADGSLLLDQIRAGDMGGMGDTDM